MKYGLIISPKSLEDSLISESKRLMKEVYGKEVNNIYYRVKTKSCEDNPRRLFIPGDGRVLEAEIKPHISLIHDLEIKDIKEFTEKAKAICRKYQKIRLEFAEIGNYGMDFTFFVGFRPNRELEKLRYELLQLTKSRISPSFLPHATILYDDIDPERIIKAYKLANKCKFQKPVVVREILLSKITMTDQGVIQRTNVKLPLDS